MSCAATAHAARANKKKGTELAKPAPTPPAATPASSPALVVPEYSAPPLESLSAKRWGTRGGATLGGRDGVRADVFFGDHRYNDGYGYAGLEGLYLLSVLADMDVGLGVRVPFYSAGVAPGAQWRWRLLRTANLELAVELGAWLSFSWPGHPSFGAVFEPGVMLSYFFRDDMELFFGAGVVAAPLLVPVAMWQVAGSARVGFAYTFERSPFGLFSSVDLAPGYYYQGWGQSNVRGIAFTNVPIFGFGFGVNAMVGGQLRFQ